MPIANDSSHQCQIQRFSINEINKTKRRYEERCELLIATKEQRIELAASVLNQKTVDYAATTMRTNIWTPNDDEAKTSIDTRQYR